MKNSKAAGGRREMKRDVVLKVVYISTPMKVKTTEAGFKNLVQELTGKDSDTARLMEQQQDFNLMMVEEEATAKSDHDQAGMWTSSDSTTTSGLDAFDECDHQGSFMSMVQSSFFDDLCQFDALMVSGVSLSTHI